MKVKAVDLFCGIGGLTKGFENIGIPVVMGIDSDDSCRYAYEKNTKSMFLHTPIEELDINVIQTCFRESNVSILIGCAPCQPFSNYSLRYNKNGMKDEKWKLINHFLDVIQQSKPHIISMENVPQLEKQMIFKKFVRTLKALGYHVTYSVVNCVDYGVPQKRKRLVLLASLYGPIGLISQTHEKPVTVRESIGMLQSIESGEQSVDDPFHIASKLSDINLRRIQQSRPGGTWKDWDIELLLPCYKKETGKGYKSVYGRMEWDKPAPTITTQFYGYGNGRFGHPSQDRALSLREGALLQSFPIDYDFGLGHTNFNMRKVGTHIGNAVPVKLAEAIGLSILNHLQMEGKCER